MASVIIGQIHRDDNKKQRVGLSIEKSCPNWKQQSILQKSQTLKIWVNSITVTY